jgi:NADPH-dependent 2,4-dienoyl-CoA reductase/sulfur reductase-like enzyme
MRRIVIVGHGIAGVTAADSLRAAGFDGRLIIVGDEPHAAYSRPALSKAALLDPQDMVSHELPEAAHGAEVVGGVTAVGLDVERRRVLLGDGQDLGYDGLVVASGSRARKLTAPDGGPGDPREHTLRTVEDALPLRAALPTAPSVAVVGSGPLAMEVASGSVARGCRVTLVTDMQPLTRLVGDYVAGIVERAALDRGLTIVTVPASGLVGEGEASGVALADGSLVPADLVVSAIGDVPNVEWLEGSGLLQDGRLIVDDRGRVRDGIVAAGDVAWFPTTRGLRRVPLWTSAIDQAKVAAVALLQGDEAPALSFSPYFWTDGFGVSVKAGGWLPVAGPPDEVLAGDAEEGAGLMRWMHADGTPPPSPSTTASPCPSCAG